MNFPPPPPVINMPAPKIYFNPKPPKTGDRPGEYRLGEWLHLIKEFMEMDNLWDLIENWDVPIDEIEANPFMAADNARARYLLVSHCGEKYKTMIQTERRARDMWLRLNEVTLFYVYINRYA